MCKPCQDFSFSIKSENYAIAVVSDGHGGKRYYRSDVGSKIAVEVAHRCLVAFAENIPPTLFADFPRTVAGAGDIYQTELQQLVRAIVVGWRNAVMEHVATSPLSETEQAIAQPDDDYGWETTYGCTLIATLLTPRYWLALQIGDGKCVAINKEGEPFEPIPWDDRCFLNRTTSICDTTAADEFRYCIGGRETAPVAIFLGSDGIDDSFGEEENLYNFYIQLAKGFVKDGYDATIADLVATLPVLSKRGSQDDMSVAGWYDEMLEIMHEKLIRYQINALVKKNESKSSELIRLWRIILHFESCPDIEAQHNDIYDRMIRISNKIKNNNAKIKSIENQL